MAKWARPRAAQMDVRPALLAHYERMVEGRPWAKERLYGTYLDALRSGRPLVLPAWAVASHVPDGVIERGKQAFYRVEADGRLVPVVARRDPENPVSIVAWDEVTS